MAAIFGSGLAFTWPESGKEEPDLFMQTAL